MTDDPIPTAAFDAAWLTLMDLTAAKDAEILGLKNALAEQQAANSKRDEVIAVMDRALRHSNHCVLPDDSQALCSVCKQMNEEALAAAAEKELNHGV